MPSWLRMAYAIMAEGGGEGVVVVSADRWGWRVVPRYGLQF